FGHHVGRVRDAVAHVRGEAGGAQTGGRRRRAGPPRSEEERQPQEAPEESQAEGKTVEEILNPNYFPFPWRERVRVRGSPEGGTGFFSDQQNIVTDRGKSLSPFPTLILCISAIFSATGGITVGPPSVLPVCRRACLRCS